MPQMKPEDCIFYSLAKASQAGNKFMKTAVSEFKLTAVQGMVLNFLHDSDGITSRELGAKTGLDSATLTGLLDRLQAAGWVERKQHPTDRRAIVICLTEKGRELVETTYNEIDNINEIFLNCLTPKENTQLRDLLIKVRKNADSAFLELEEYLAQRKAQTG